MTPTLNAQQLTRYAGKHALVHEVSLTLRRGEVLALLGHNGAGKSTTLQMLAGVLTPHSGSITVCDFDLVKQPKQAKSCIGFLPDTPPLYRDMRVDDYLIFVAKLHHVCKPILARVLSESKQRCGLQDSGQKIISTLSKGYQQRVGIAQAIIHQPAVVILDEPTVGLDPAQMRDICALIRELGDAHSVILSTHLLSEVKHLCDRVAVMQQGKIIYQGSSEEMQQLAPNGTLEDVFVQLTASVASTTEQAA